MSTTIQVWVPTGPEITLEAYNADGSGIVSGNDGNLTVDETTVSGALVITGRSQQPLVLSVTSVVSQNVVGDLDELRIAQRGGAQAAFRFNDLVSTNDLDMNRTATGVTEQWGQSTRTRFEAPCLVVFPQEWFRLAAASESRTNQTPYELDLTIQEIP